MNGSPHISEIGDPLTPTDFAMLAHCGVDRQTAESALVRRVDSFTGAEVVGRNGSGDYAGIVFPYFWPGEEHCPREYRLRRDHPEMELGKNGRPKPKDKYLGPPDRPPKLYFPRGTRPGWLLDPAMQSSLSRARRKP